VPKHNETLVDSILRLRVSPTGSRLQNELLEPLQNTEVHYSISSSIIKGPVPLSNLEHCHVSVS
jgi:hypothetical protein